MTRDSIGPGVRAITTGVIIRRIQWCEVMDLYDLNERSKLEHIFL
jgi:hypothetical protein